MDSMQDQVKLVHAESERLKEYLNTLPPEAWSRPSACEHWEVGDVVAHLSWAAGICAESISRGVQGDVSPVEGMPPMGSISPGSANEFVGEQTIAHRQELGERLLPTFVATTDRLNQLLAGLDEADWDKPCYNIFRTWPVWVFIGSRFEELAIHGWDIRSRLEPEAHLSAESLPGCIERIPPRLGRLELADFRLSSRPTAPVRYRFAVTGAVPVSTTWWSRAIAAGWNLVGSVRPMSPSAVMRRLSCCCGGTDSP